MAFSNKILLQTQETIKLLSELRFEIPKRNLVFFAFETPDHISSVSEICGDVLFFSAPCCVVVVIPFNAHCLIFSHVFVEYRIIRFSFFTNYTRRIIIQGFLFSAADPLLLRLGTLAKISVILQSKKCAHGFFLKHFRLTSRV